MRHRLLIICLAPAIAALLAAPVRACTLDGVPSLSGNGALAQRNAGRASVGHLANWATFQFARTFSAGTLVRFSENTADLHRSLPAQAFGKPWRWTFGDGASQTGYNVKHSYRHAGVYKLTVSAYYAIYKAWYQFDDALIHVAPVRK